MALSDRRPEAPGCLIALNKREGAAATGRPRGTNTNADAGRVEAPVPAPHFPPADRGAVVPFRRIDAALLLPFAALLGAQSRGARRQGQVKDLFTGLTRSLIATIEAKDRYTSGHSERVARVAVELGRELGLQDVELSDLYLGALLHDIGKIGIPDSILGKRGPLDPGEFAEIRQHVIIGWRILEDFRAIAHLLPLVLYHHEHFDGAGYPEGLKGGAIPLAARVLAVADSYDAMSSSRPYRDAMPRPRIEEILARGSDAQWDGRVIAAFFRTKDRIYAIDERGIGESVWFALDNAFRQEGPGQGSSRAFARAQATTAGVDPGRPARASCPIR
jgi:putative nucleotidyltransferase with HDIG domain